MKQLAAEGTFPDMACRVLRARRTVPDPVRRNFTAEAKSSVAQRFTEHRIGERNVYLGTAKNGFCHQVVGYSIDPYMKSPAVI
ncbi:hypothetical protein [Nocardia cerradoensis]|uniref:hypothetical protein n=1 Tax=Nocardia cerradoensis TaxID=85688 RepID=UPI0012F6E16E|nr:hypothetical protein [Nocardia cerradoensis]NKY43325.1 hypothetical protein [Nocardia cerradoensis]